MFRAVPFFVAALSCFAASAMPPTPTERLVRNAR